MASIRLTVEQVTFDAAETSSLDSFGSVVDANIDFRLPPNHYNQNSATDQLLVNENVKQHHDTKRDWASYLPAFKPEINDNKLCIPEGGDKCLPKCSADVNPPYPDINQAVAHFLTQNSPDLYHQAAEVLHSSLITSSLPKHSDSIPEPVFTSAFKSMASTTEALALQQSVIGNSCIQPVSEDVVAQVVANTQKRLQSLKSEMNSPNNIESSVAKELLVPNSQKMSPLRKPKSKTIDGVIYKEIVPYPHETLVATTEKRAWIFGSQSNTDESSQGTPQIGNSPKRKHNKRDKQRRDSQSSISSIGSITSGKVAFSADLPATHHGRRSLISSDCASAEDKSTFSESSDVKFDDVFFGGSRSELSDEREIDTLSDKIDVESLQSESMDSMSGMSTLEETMFKIENLFAKSSPFSNTERSANSFNSLDINNCVILNNKHTQTEIVSSVDLAHTSKAEDKSTSTAGNENECSHFEVLRKKAHLEGEVELLQSEIDKLVKEQSQMQSLIASLECDVTSYKTKLEQESGERKSIQQKLDKLHYENQQWQQVINDYQHVIETKTSEINTLKSNLTESDNNNNKLHVDIEHLKVDLDSKDGAIQGLKKKIAELHVEVHTNLQDKIELENQLKSTKVELEMMQKSKSWYQEQLKIAQDLRNKIHQELIATQAESISASNSTEQVKVENCQLKQQLIETQQRAVKEKEMLMKHLETIEADMIERESIFKELQKEKGSNEKNVAERLKKIDEEHSVLTNLKFLASDLELQLENTKKDLSSKEKHALDLEKDRSELTKQNTRLQKMLTESEMNYSKLEQEVKRLEGKLKHLHIELSMKDEQIQKMKNEQTAKDVALAAVNEEKRTVYEALQNLKANLNDVEKNFKHMRSELVTKSLEFDQLQKEKDRLEELLQKAEQRLLQQKHVYETQPSSQQLQTEIKELELQNARLEQIVVSVKDELKSCQLLCSLLAMEKEKAERIASDFENQTKTLQSQLNNASKRKSVDQGTFNEIGSCTEIASGNQNSSERVSYETYQQLTETMQKAENDYKNKLKSYESNVKVLMRKLREEMKSKKKVENELIKLKSILSNSDKIYVSQFVQTENGADTSVAEEKEGESVNELKTDLQDALERCKELQLTVETKENIILQLEKEMGRLTGVTDSHNMLKQHVSELEGQLAAKEFTVTEMAQRTMDLEQKHKEEMSKINERLSVYQEQLQKEKALVKELRHQVFQEKRQNSHMKRQVDNLKSGLHQANHIADSRQQLVMNISTELEQKVQECTKYQGEIESLQMKTQQLQIEVKRLEKQLEETKSRDPALADQMNTLSWHLKQKNQEILALKQQLSLIEERHQTEINGLHKQLQDAKTDLKNAKTELTTTRKEKFGYQSQVTELRGALKLSLDQIKQLREQLSQRTKESNDLEILDLPLPESPAPLDEAFINTLLMQSSMPSENRPLSNLQACLNSLKEEMSELQKQLKERMDEGE